MKRFGQALDVEFSLMDCTNVWFADQKVRQSNSKKIAKMDSKLVFSILIVFAYCLYGSCVTLLNFQIFQHKFLIIFLIT